MALNRWPKGHIWIWELNKKTVSTCWTSAENVTIGWFKFFAIVHTHQWPQKHGIYWFSRLQNKSYWVDELKNIEWMNN